MGYHLGDLYPEGSLHFFFRVLTTYLILAYAATVFANPGQLSREEVEYVMDIFERL